MGNNNLDNTQNQDTKTTPQGTGDSSQTQPQAQGSDTGAQGGGDSQSSGSDTPTIAELMKENAELKVDNRRLKKANDSISSEIAGIKKQLNAKMTEEELKAQQKSEEQDAIKQELSELRKENALNKATKRYMSMKMPEELATKVAQAEIDGDMETVTSSINAFMEAQKKEVEEKVTADLYAKMPAPMSGNGDGQIDYEKQYQEKLNSGDVQGAIEAQISGMFATQQPS